MEEKKNNAEIPTPVYLVDEGGEGGGGGGGSLG